MKIIGISGKSGSGKTSLIRSLRKTFDESVVCIVSLDNYYKPRSEQNRDEQGYLNFDEISSFDWKQLLMDLSRLIVCREVEKQTYTFNNEEEPTTFVLKPADIIIVEGILTLAHPEVRSLLDYSIIIDAPDDLCRQRRLQRDQSERNYKTKEILHRFDNHVLPTYNSCIEPLKDSVDLVLINDGDLAKVEVMLIDAIRSLMLPEILPLP